MENAAEALMIAGAVLIFILILSIVFFAFTNARESIDTIFEYSNKESMTIQNDDYYYLSTAGQNSNISRKVGLETIIPTIYRAFYEHFKIEFVFENSDYCLYKDRNNNQINSLDLSEITLSNSQQESFIGAILYHTYKGRKSMVEFNKDFRNNRSTGSLLMNQMKG